MLMTSTETSNLQTGKSANVFSFSAGSSFVFLSDSQTDLTANSKDVWIFLPYFHFSSTYSDMDTRLPHKSPFKQEMKGQFPCFSLNSLAHVEISSYKISQGSEMHFYVYQLHSFYYEM